MPVQLPSTFHYQRLCPVEAYCPNGPKESKALFLQNDAFLGEQWAPIYNYNTFNWVMVGQKDNDPQSICKGYEQIYDGQSPLWTEDGSKSELKENVLCCIQQDNMKHEQDVARGMRPIWLDNTHGWNGGSHVDAQKFCTGLGGKRLCPYAACEFFWCHV